MSLTSKTSERQRALSAAVSNNASKLKAKSVTWQIVYTRVNGEFVRSTICCGIRHVPTPPVDADPLPIVDRNILTTTCSVSPIMVPYLRGKTIAWRRVSESDLNSIWNESHEK